MNNKMQVTSGFLDWLLAFVIIIGSNTVYASLSFSKYVALGLGLISAIIVLLRLIIVNFTSVRVLVSRNSAVSLALFLLVAVLYLIVHPIFWAQHFGQLANFLGLFIIFVPAIWIYMSVFGCQNLLKKYVQLMFIIASLSLAFWVAFSVLKVIPPTNYVNLHWGGHHDIPSFFNIYFETQQKNILSHIIVRNSGIWPEGPMFTLSLTFALLSELFINRDAKTSHVTIFLVALLSTFTSTGYIVILMLSAIFIWRSTAKLMPKYRFLLVVIVLIILALPGVPIFVRLLERKLQGYSGSVRIDDYIAGFKSWWKRPLVGHGMNNNKALYRVMNMDIRRYYTYEGVKYNKGIANAWTPLFSDGGLILPILYGSGIVAFLRMKKQWIVIAFFILILMFLSVMQYTTITLTFLFAVPFAKNDESSVPKNC